MAGHHDRHRVGRAGAADGADRLRIPGGQCRGPPGVRPEPRLR